jgi:hypothetical protein
MIHTTNILLHGFFDGKNVPTQEDLTGHIKELRNRKPKSSTRTKQGHKLLVKPLQSPGAKELGST